MSLSTKQYALGFLFVNDHYVVLIRKNKPAWQEGKLNGVGGLIEPGETCLDAMRREWFEETGEERKEWEKFCTANFGSGVKVHMYRAWDRESTARTNTEELVTFAPLEQVYKGRVVTNFGVVPVLPNLRYLIPLALSGDHVHYTQP